MKFRQFCLVAIAGAAILAGLCVQAEDASIQGRYRVQVDSDTAEQIEVTIRLQLINRTSVAVEGLEPLFVATLDSTEVLGAVPRVNLPAGGVANIETSLVIPRHEYALWEKGAVPKLLVRGSQESGMARPFRVDLDRDDELEFGGAGQSLTDGPVDIQRRTSTEEGQP
jgi:hypothetical protein